MRMAFISWIAQNPQAGDVIPGADGARKVRWAMQGRGKSGGVRVVYFNLSASGFVLLFAIYAKAVRANMSAKEIKAV